MKQNLSPIQIISASAGSGKTYTLVFHFLKTLLSNPNAKTYKQMIGLTFTNKAVLEMKTRILEYLNEFSNIKKASTMSSALCEALDISQSKLQHRSQHTLKSILHDYSAFEVVTLDNFTHRVIRSFAKDLGLSFSFEVEIQKELMLQYVVNRVIDKAGENNEITSLLHTFVSQKSAAGLSSDIGQNLMDIANLILNENNRMPLTYFINQSRDKFNTQYEFLNTFSENCKKEIKDTTTQALQLIEENELTSSDFSRGLLFNHFKKLNGYNLDSLAKKNLDGVYKNKLEENLGLEENIYNKSLADDKKERIDKILPELKALFHKTKKAFYNYYLAKEVKKEWIPLSLIKVLSEELETYQQEQNKVLLSTFNERIAKEILLSYNTPHIYERLGENYRHYFLDEFQDTSLLQWSNLIPLISPSLESMDAEGLSGSLLIVGDPKQAIYRWRGGHVNQFLSLSKGNIPFQVEANISALETNYRSFDTIVNFNNSFFKYLLNSPTYSAQNKEIFKEASEQNTNNKTGGYVEVNQFHSELNTDDVIELHIQKSYDAIQSALAQGFEYNEIAVLVRTNKIASVLCEFLAEHNVPFISSESLNLSNSSEVQFLIALLHLSVEEEEHSPYKLSVLEFLKKEYGANIAYHKFVSSNLNLPIQTIFNNYNIDFLFQSFKSASLYEAVEYAFYAFGLSAKVDTYLQSFLDHAFEFSLQKNNDILYFLKDWHLRKDSLFVSTPKGFKAIQVLSIHKAKGLEFPVVIIPCLENLIIPKNKDRVWLDTRDVFGDALEKGWLLPGRLEHFGANGMALSQQLKEESELDALNVLYVAMTRAVEQLYVSFKIKNPNSKSAESLYPSIIENYFSIYQEEDDDFISFGNKKPSVSYQEQKTIDNSFSLSPKANQWQSRLLTQTYTHPEDVRASQKTKGILIHELLSQIETANDIEWALERASVQGKLDANYRASLHETFNSVINHPKLKNYFEGTYKVWNERDILIPESADIRPDKILEGDNEVVLIDYKTGKSKKDDQTQLEYYKKIISQIFKDKNVTAVLVYIKEQETPDVVLV